MCTVNHALRTTGLVHALTGLPSVATSDITNTSGKINTLTLSRRYRQCANRYNSTIRNAHMESDS